MSLTPDDIKRVIGALADSDWDEAVVTVGDVSIAVARNGATLSGHVAPPPPAAPAAAAPPVVPVAPAPAAAPVAAPAPAAIPSATTGVDVKAPSIGVFWRAPEPGAAPFVEVGQRVEAGQEMCIIEVMKLMNRVQAPVTGVVEAVHIANGEAVEFATPLFTIIPA